MQLSFLDTLVSEPPRPASLRPMVFFGIRLAPLALAAAAIVGALARDYRLTHGLRPAATQHVSLLRVGHGDRLTRDDRQALCAAAAGVAFAPFDISFDTVMSFTAHRPAPFPLILSVAEGAAPITALARAIETRAFRHAIRPEGGPPGMPHMTLLYDPARIPPTPLPAPLAARIDRFDLIWSHRGQSRYTSLWPDGAEP